jgi:hypothetical protein
MNSTWERRILRLPTLIKGIKDEGLIYFPWAEQAMITAQ